MFDLDAVVVESDDAEPFRFTWGGKDFELLPFISLPANRQIAVIDQVYGDKVDAAKLLTVLREILGDDLIAELSATKGGPSNKPMSTMRLMSLIMAWVNAQDPGKSQASSDSSGSTAQPSKPTSRSARARKTSSPSSAAASSGGASKR